MKLVSLTFLLGSFFLLNPSHVQQNENLWLRHTTISPKGNQIAFTYNAYIYVVPVNGGKATRLTSNSAYDTKPAWSQDGQQIAFASNRGYKDLKTGKLFRMPVPGTCSFVWRERIQNGIVFGKPNMQGLDIEGDVLENKELIPDIQVKNGFEAITHGKDEQIEAAVRELLKSVY